MNLLADSGKSAGQKHEKPFESFECCCAPCLSHHKRADVLVHSLNTQKGQGATCESPPSCTASQNIARLDCRDVDQSDSHGKQPAALTARGESWVVKVLSYEQKLWVVIV